MKLGEIHKHIQEWVFLLDNENNVIEANRSALKQFSSLEGKNIHLVLNDKKLPSEIELARETGFYQEQRLINSSAAYFSGFISIYQVEANIILTIRNVSRFKEKESRLLESEHQKNAMIEAIPDIMFLFNASGVYLDFRAKDNNELFFKPSEFINKSIYELYTSNFANQIQNCIDKCLEDGKVEILEYEMSHKGNNVCYEARFVKSGTDKVLVLSREVTRIKESINALNKSIEEKENLLKEIHHRVKNNLQVIYSLVRNQMRYVKDKEAIEILEVTSNRVNAMALVHQKLYTNQHITNVNLKEYFRDLLQNLNNCFGGSNLATINTSIEDIELNIDKALSVGLIINEIVTNSYKHAFEGDTLNSIVFSCHKNNNVMVIDISDNGIGKASYIQENQSFGLKLVDMMVDKLKGKKRVYNKNGLAYKIEIPLKN